MKLEFRLLLIDDEPGSVGEALLILGDHLKAKGFTLATQVPDDLSPRALRKLAQREGRDYDLVIIDFNLGMAGSTGADVALSLRHQLPYTDIIFYSSDPSMNLLQELAKKEVAGVFVAYRPRLGESLTGIADTVIGKAVDLNHMRGIAMAEVAEIDVIMEECLQNVFSSNVPGYEQAAKATLDDLLERTKNSLDHTEKLCGEGSIVDVISDSRIFSSAHKFYAIRRVAKHLPNKPVEALAALNSYEADIIANRNILAHAKEDLSGEVQTLRAARANADPIVIDDTWMAAFRTNLKAHRDAIVVVCTALTNDVQAAPQA